MSFLACHQLSSLALVTCRMSPNVKASPMDGRAGSVRGLA